MSSGLVGLHMKSQLKGAFAISRNWQTLAGIVPLESAKPQDIKASEYKNKRCI